jgi:hypothetical protein
MERSVCFLSRWTCLQLRSNTSAGIYSAAPATGRLQHSISRDTSARFGGAASR